MNSLGDHKPRTIFSLELRFLILFIVVIVFEVFELVVVTRLSEFEIFRIDKIITFEYVT